MSAPSALHGALILLALSACQGVLGIQELTEEPRPGAPGAGGTEGSGGPTDIDTPAAVGTGGTGETGASLPPVRDTPQPGPESASLPTPVPLSDAGAPDATAPTPGITVAGRVIDFFRRPVPDTVVSIGASTAVTDADGRFSIADVVPPYTASFVANVFRGGGQGRYGYVYEGLTRGDPTLQTYSVLPQRGASSLLTTYPNTTFDPGRFAIVAFGSPDGAFSDDEATNGTEYLGAPAWSGPASITGSIHALLCTHADTFDPPSGYDAYQTLPLTATDNAQASATFDNLPLASLTVGTLGGNVSGGLFDPLTNYIALRFSDGSAMPIVDEAAVGAAFQYVVPDIAGASFVVGAADGTSSFPPYAVAHRENVAFGEGNVALAIPLPVTLQSPQNGVPDVTPSTPYSWSTVSQTAQTFLWHLEFNDTFEGMFVLTSRTQIELPRFADGFTVPQTVAVTWSVETHGDAPSVDAFAGPDGYLDAFSSGESYPIGPNRADGYYTESERRGFVMGAD